MLWCVHACVVLVLLPLLLLLSHLSQGKVVFITPTRPLVEQQFQACKAFMGIHKVTQFFHYLNLAARTHNAVNTCSCVKAEAAKFWHWRAVCCCQRQHVFSFFLFKTK
jgi:hypothetical protein